MAVGINLRRRLHHLSFRTDRLLISLEEHQRAQHHQQEVQEQEVLPESYQSDFRRDPSLVLEIRCRKVLLLEQGNFAEWMLVLLTAGR